MINDTHRPDRRSWVESANAPRADFPIQNLPFGVFRGAGDDSPRVGVAIGDRVLDISALRAALFDGDARVAVEACAEPTLNAFMALGPACWSALRLRLSTLLDAGAGDAAANRRAVEPCLAPMHDVAMLLPADIGDYTDFYASIHHATHVGSMFRPDNPLLPNYRHVPIGYHGRASSIVVSGTPVHRPSGQTKADDAEAPLFGAARMLDYEVEVGAFVGPGNAREEDIPIARAHEHLFGLCLVNDWSARHPEVGVSTARPVSRQELCHHREPVGCDDGSARAVSCAGVFSWGRRSHGASVSIRHRGPGDRLIRNPH
jgi:fumarylacetoacetase